MMTEELALDSPTRRLLSTFLDGRNPSTVLAYQRDLAAFCAPDSIPAGAERLLSLSHGEANLAIFQYRASMQEKGLAPATINRRLAAVRSLVKLARTIGMVPWAIDVPNVKEEKYRDTRGPGADAMPALLGATESSRDRAIVHLLFDLALRRVEVTRLDLEDYRPPSLWVLGKGKAGKLAVTPPPPTVEALERWLGDRGDAPGPMFCNLDGGHARGRLDAGSVNRIVGGLAKKAGLPHIRPHGLRHSSITLALEMTNGNVRDVQKFSRHRDVRTISTYDDARTDIAGRVAAMVAG